MPREFCASAVEYMHAVIVANAPDLDARPFAALLGGADIIIAADGGGDALAQAVVPSDAITPRARPSARMTRSSSTR